MASFQPFLPVYMSYLGLSVLQTGIIRGIEPFLYFLIAPLWGILCDKYSKHREVLLGTMAVSSVLYCCTYFVPRVADTRTWTALTNSTPVVGLNVKYSSTPWVMMTSGLSKRNVSSSLGNQQIMIFIIMMIIIFTAKSLFCTTCSLLDAVTMALTKEHRSDYGKQRLWGAVSWGLFAVISGAAVDACVKSCPTRYIYAPAFGLYALFTTLSVLTAFKMTFQTHQSPSESISGNIGLLLRNPEILVFLLLQFVVGANLGAISTYLFLLLQELHGPHSLMGLTLTVSCVSEVPFMYFSSRIIQCFGHKSIFYLCLVCYAVRCGCYSILRNPWFVLPVELLHGICYGAFWPASTSYCNLVAPQGMEATVQNAANAVNAGLGKYRELIVADLSTSAQPDQC